MERHAGHAKYMMFPIGNGYKEKCLFFPLTVFCRKSLVVPNNYGISFPYGVPMVNIAFSVCPTGLSIHFAILLHDQIMVLVFISIHDYVQSIKYNNFNI